MIVNVTSYGAAPVGPHRAVGWRGLQDSAPLFLGNNPNRHPSCSELTPGAPRPPAAAADRSDPTTCAPLSLFPAHPFQPHQQPAFPTKPGSFPLLGFCPDCVSGPSARTIPPWSALALFSTLLRSPGAQISWSVPTSPFPDCFRPSQPSLMRTALTSMGYHGARLLPRPCLLRQQKGVSTGPRRGLCGLRFPLPDAEPSPACTQ